MNKYIITYKFSTKQNDPSHTERRQSLIDYFEDNIFEDDNDTTSTLIVKDYKNGSNLAKDIITECELINEDRILLFRVKKSVIQYIGKIKNRKLFRHKKLEEWLNT